LCVSSIKRGEFTINSLHKDKQWIISVIWKCWQAYGNLFGREDPELWPDKWFL
jgi:hypothetical protein